MAPSTPRNINALERITSISRSFPDSSPIAQASIARDLEDLSDSGASESSEDEVDSDLDLPPSNSAIGTNYSFAGSYRRPSFTNAGPRATVVGHGGDRNKLSKKERAEALQEERSLLRDNNLIPPKHPQAERDRRSSVFGRSLSIAGIPGGDRKVVRTDAEPAVAADRVLSEASESTALLGDPDLPYGGLDDPKDIAKRWDEAVSAGFIQTTWQRELKVLGKYSAPLMLTFLLQYSLTVASIFTVGHLGKAELGAVSLASMTANITGYAIYQGLATSLDTLCAQAYGSGKKKLVGLQMQRMVYFLWSITIPIGIIWILADKILMAIVPEKEVAVLAGLYLKVVLIGAPGYAAFESGKRFMQAQGLFSASLYVLLFCAPFNAFMNWLFVWASNPDPTRSANTDPKQKFKWGFVGAPIAVAIVDILLPICLFLYVQFVAGKGCWNGFTRRAFQNWIPMIKLALPGLLMVEAEVLAFEVLTLASSYFGTTHLAAQSVLATLTSLTFQIPFPLSIAASTRIANLIGATLTIAARTSAKVAMCLAVIVGCLNVIFLAALKDYIPRLFTSDADVIQLVSDILPICAAFQLFDALAANCNGILRGLGRQEIGGYVQVFCYYAIAMPISFGTAFGLGWELRGLWTGVAIALGLVALFEAIFLSRASWEKSVEDARERNAMS